MSIPSSSILLLISGIFRLANDIHDDVSQIHYILKPSRNINMRSKHAVPTQRASAANKPFMTEYRLAYKDPTASQKRKIPLSKKAQQQAKSAEPKKEPVMRIVVEEVINDGLKCFRSQLIHL